MDGDDFLVWQQQFGSQGAVGSDPIPEPASWGLLAILLAFAAVRRSRTAIAAAAVICLVFAPLVTPVAAQDEFVLELVQSEDIFGEPFNDLRFVNSSTAEPYVINNVRWSGLVSPLPDPSSPDDPPPSWGRDLSVRITHDQSGNVAELQLGQSGFFSPGPVTFEGFEFSQLHGTTVSPGDTFSMEFYELTDHFAGVDAEWVNLTFNLDPISGGVEPPPIAPGEVRAEAVGINSWGTNIVLGGTPLFPDAVNFWGISFGETNEAGTGNGGGEPPLWIAEVEIQLSEDGSVYWHDINSALTGPFVGDSVGIDENPTIVFSDPGSQVATSFTTATFEFVENEFVEGDKFLFGIDTDAFGFDVDMLRIRTNAPGLDPAGFGGEMPGAEFANLSAISQSPVVTVTFSDGSQLTGAIDVLGTGKGPGGFFSFGLIDEVVPVGPEADFDKDGDVDGDDFLVWQTGFGTTSGAGPNDGDADGDGDVDGDDFLVWQTQFNQFPGTGSGGSVVPEPSTALLLLAALAAAFSRRR